MNNKVLVGIIVVLAAALIFETAYLLGSKKRADHGAGALSGQPRQSRSQAPGATQGQVFPRSYMPDPDLGIFDDMSGRDPFADMERMQKRMHRLFDDSFSKGLIDRSIFRMHRAFEPDISIGRENGSYTIKVDLPGMEKDQISIEVRGRELVVSGERRAEETKQDKGFYRQELSYGSFSRSVLLPEDAVTGEISSEYKNGVLIIVIPRQQDVKAEAPPIKVTVK